MTKAQRDIRRKKRVLDHAQRIGNVRTTCRHFGIPRSLFYVWKWAYEREGEPGLVNRKPRPANPTPRTVRQRRKRSCTCVARITSAPNG